MANYQGTRNLGLHNDATYSILLKYHVDLANVTEVKTPVSKRFYGSVMQQLKKSDCGTGDPRIHYCVSHCWLSQSEISMIYSAALESKSAAVVANKIYNNLESKQNRIVSVLSVNLYAIPQAQLNQQMVMGERSYCSVYIGMETIGMPYLYEIQVAKVVA
uniref:Helitron helicase n=1 Tax=Syphacia muris TaxID=451379 RepID=A0A0N5AJL8_9BILA